MKVVIASRSSFTNLLLPFRNLTVPRNREVIRLIMYCFTQFQLTWKLKFLRSALKWFRNLIGKKFLSLLLSCCFYSCFHDQISFKRKEEKASCSSENWIYWGQSPGRIASGNFPDDYQHKKYSISWNKEDPWEQKEAMKKQQRSGLL